MTSLEMVQYNRTADMESLYLMLNNDSSIYELWHDTATRLAMAATKGKCLNYDELAKEYSRKIAYSLDRLCVRHHKICGDWLQVTDQQKEIVAWQWFYCDIMDSVLFTKQKINFELCTQ